MYKFIKSALLILLAANSMFGMEKEQTNPLAITQQELPSLLKYDKNRQSKEEYLNQLYRVANVLYAQEACANLVSIIKNCSAILNKECKEEKYTEMKRELQQGKNFAQASKSLFLKNLIQSKNLVLSTPESIAMGLQISHKEYQQGTIYHKSHNWETYKNLCNHSNKEIQLLAHAILDQQKQLQTHDQLYDRYSEWGLLLRDILNHQWIVPEMLKLFKINQILKPLISFKLDTQKSYLKHNDLFKNINSMPHKNLNNLEDKLNLNNIGSRGARIIEQQDISANIQSMELSKELNKIRNTFLNTYQENRPNALQAYQIIRKELKDITGTNIKFKNYKLKLFNDSSKDEILPLTFKEYLATFSLENEEIKEEEEEELSGPLNNLSVTPTASQNQPKKKKSRANKKNSSAPACPVIKPAAKPAAIIPNKPLTKDIPDPKNHCTHSIFRAMRQADPFPLFANHNRIYEWFNNGQHTLAKQGYLDPNNPKNKFINTAIAQHSFPFEIDKLARKWAIVQDGQDKNSNPIKILELPGCMQCANQPSVFGIYIFCIKNGMCYHRCFHPKSAQELLNEYLEEQTWKVTLEEYND